MKGKGWGCLFIIMFNYKEKTIRRYTRVRVHIHTYFHGLGVHKKGRRGYDVVHKKGRRGYDVERRREVVDFFN